jgi:hypothetical protein
MHNLDLTTLAQMLQDLAKFIKACSSSAEKSLGEGGAEEATHK